MEQRQRSANMSVGYMMCKAPSKCNSRRPDFLASNSGPKLQQASVCVLAHRQDEVEAIEGAVLFRIEALLRQPLIPVRKADFDVAQSQNLVVVRILWCVVCLARVQRDFYLQVFVRREGVGHVQL